MAYIDTNKKTYDVLTSGYFKRVNHKSEFIESSGYRILDRISTDEKNREKKWVAFICEKI